MKPIYVGVKSKNRKRSLLVKNFGVSVLADASRFFLLVDCYGPRIDAVNSAKHGGLGTKR